MRIASGDTKQLLRMFQRIKCLVGPSWRPSGGVSGAFRIRRRLGNVHVPFHDDLDPADDDLFNLEDFKHYQESPDMIARNQDLLRSVEVNSNECSGARPIPVSTLRDAAAAREPSVFISTLCDPYLNLAIEDYIYNKMPLPEKTGQNYNRLMFYTNSPCVVIGKNQNPWKEANVPLLNSLHIPLIRRKSGGGTVVHDSGNVNFSFMTTKAHFDRFKFVELVCGAVNKSGHAKSPIKVNDRGDIVTHSTNHKVSGSAYKLSKGKSYHHGTMLLNLKLDVLRQLLSTSAETNGIVSASASVNSVKSKVANIEMENDRFVEIVSEAFAECYGDEVGLDEDQKRQNELFGISDFVESNLKTLKPFAITENTVLEDEIHNTANELRSWDWKFGATPKFKHEFLNSKLGFTATFIVGRNAVLEDFELHINKNSNITPEKLQETFEFLRLMVDQNSSKPLEQKLRYRGSDIAGFITNDEISDWIGQTLDGTA